MAVPPRTPTHHASASSLARLRSTTLALVALVAGVTLLTIAIGYVVVGRGDPSLRVLISFGAARDLSGFARRWQSWTGDWPAGHFLIQGTWIRILQWVGVRSTGSLAQGVLMLSPLSWLVSAALVQRIVARVRGAMWGWIAVLGFLALPHLTELAHNAYGEIYFVGFYLLTLWLLTRFEERGGTAWLLVAALPLLAASAIRTEAVVVAAGIAVALVATRRWGAGIIFLAVSSPLTLARLFSHPALIAAQVDVLPWPDRLLNFGILALYFVVPNAVALFALAVAFSSRPPLRAAANHAQAVALYAASSAGFLFAFSFSAMLFLTSIGPHTRLLAVPLVGALVALACTGEAPEELAWESMRRWIAPWVVVFLFAQLFLLGVDFIAERARPPEGIRDASRWLAAHGAPGRLAALDHTDGWEFTLLLYGSRTPAEAEGSYLLWRGADSRGATTETPPVALGRFIEERHPAFVVRLGGSPAWRRTGVWGPEWSFLEHWARTGRARLALRNANVEIYELIEPTAR